MAFSLHGVHVPHRKNTADISAIPMNTPETVTLPMGMHIGAPSIPVVSVGDHVNVGTLIGAAAEGLSVPVHSSVSGTVKSIAPYLQPNGKQGLSVVIESDGLDSVDPEIVPPAVSNREELIGAIRNSGIVGLGGAGFPTYVKLNVDSEKIDELIVNGAECEPYITSDSLTMTDRAEDMAYALQALERYLGIKKVIIGIEKNKKKAIARMKLLEREDPCVKVVALPAVYPQGGEKVLVYHTTGKVIGPGKLPLDVGSIVCNCTTIAAMGAYLKTGMPLVKKCITVDGSAVKEPKNVIVPIGSSMTDVFSFCGGFKEAPGKVLYGGPMMGIAVTDLSAPVLKNTNAILAFNQKDAVPDEETACIRCGSCYNHCPFGINADALSRAYAAGSAEDMEKAGAEACMECGCCAFVCPAHRPLVQTNRLAKAFLRDFRTAQKQKEKEDQK